MHVDSHTTVAASQRFEVMFKDGSTIGLHQVFQHGQPSVMLRAVRLGDSRLVVFDLGELSRQLDADLRALPARDAHGCVFYTLRSMFKSANEAMAAFMSRAKVLIVEPSSMEVAA